MTHGLLLHLSGPLQSWGAAQGGRHRDTYPHPTRSALTGMIAAAMGRPRGSNLRDLDELSFTIRVDRPGARLRDWHTIGGGYPKHRTVMTADGGRRGDAVIFEDWYLTDAAFTVAVCGPETILAQAAAALQCPVFPPHLGRRSCPPDTPVLIGECDTAHAALQTLPLHRNAPTKGDTSVDILFLTEQPPHDKPETPATRNVADVALPGRTWTTRSLWETRCPMPAALCAGRGTAYLTALTQHQLTAA